MFSQLDVLSISFFFSLLFPRLLPALPGILLPSFCRPSQPSRALGLFPSKPADHMCSEVPSHLPLCCCSQPTLEPRGGSCRQGLAELLMWPHSAPRVCSVKVEHIFYPTSIEQPALCQPLTELTYHFSTFSGFLKKSAQQLYIPALGLPLSRQLSL